jgi:hypothetical protein
VDVLECLQKNLTDQLSRMEGYWDTFDWDHSKEVFDTTKKVVDESSALVDRTLVNVEAFIRSR